jgi:hypothetical protein
VKLYHHDGLPATVGAATEVRQPSRNLESEAKQKEKQNEERKKRVIYP